MKTMLDKAIIAIAIGAHRRHGPDGWKMAIVKLPQEKEPTG
ncbi:hypothetical protein [Enterocloster clostridioformis]|nr:hypothetical protein [Enterocloster clostridioformis]